MNKQKRIEALEKYIAKSNKSIKEKIKQDNSPQIMQNIWHEACKPE